VRKLLEGLAEIVGALAQFAEQAGCSRLANDRLSGEVGQQLDLLVIERPTSWRKMVDAPTTSFSLSIGTTMMLCAEVVSVKLRVSESSLSMPAATSAICTACFVAIAPGHDQAHLAGRLEGRFARSQLHVRRRRHCVSQRRDKFSPSRSERTPNLASQMRVAFFQYGRKHRGESPGDALITRSNFGCRGVCWIQRLAQLAGAILDLLFEAGIRFLQLARHSLKLVGERLHLVSGLDVDPRWLKSPLPIRAAPARQAPGSAPPCARPGTCRR